MNDIFYHIFIYSTRTKEAITLLKLKQGSVMLLKDILNKALRDFDLVEDANQQSEDRNLVVFNARNALKEFGIISLSCQQARDVLNLRSDFVQ